VIANYIAVWTGKGRSTVAEEPAQSKPEMLQSWVPCQHLALPMEALTHRPFLILISTVMEDSSRQERKVCLKLSYLSVSISLVFLSLAQMLLQFFKLLFLCENT